MLNDYTMCNYKLYHWIESTFKRLSAIPQKVVVVTSLTMSQTFATDPTR